MPRTESDLVATTVEHGKLHKGNTLRSKLHMSNRIYEASVEEPTMENRFRPDAHRRRVRFSVKIHEQKLTFVYLKLV